MRRAFSTSSPESRSALLDKSYDRHPVNQVDASLVRIVDNSFWVKG
jgi:hypothetical protein